MLLSLLLLLNQIYSLLCLKYYYIRSPIKINENFLIQFNDVNRSDNFSNFLYYENSLYVTGTNYVFKLNPSNISDQNPSLYKEVFINPSNHFFKNSSSLKNHIKLLIFRERSQDLIVCGTNLGKPHIKDLNVKDFSSIVEFDGFYLCPGIEGYKNLGHISYENPGNSKSMTKGLMYSAIWKTHRNIHGEFFKYGIYRQEIDVASKILKSFPNVNWLWEPNFVSIIDYRDKIFYFFTEYSIEEFSLTKKLKRVSRVARVCKSDVGSKSEKNPNLNNMWLTFRKIDFNCESRFQNLILVKKIDDKLITIFYDQDQGSIICEIGLEQVKEMLENKKFWIDRNNMIDSSNFYLYNQDFDCDNIPKVKIETHFYGNKLGEDEFFNELPFGFRPKSNSQNNDDLEILNEFLSNHTILENNLEAHLILKLPVKIISMSYEEINEDVFHFGTSGNQLIIIKRNFTEFLEPISLDLGPWINNGSLIEILVKKENVYIGTTSSIYQIQFTDLFKKFCNSISQCFECEIFFFCTWLDNKCKYKQNKIKNQACFAQSKEIYFSIGENLRLDCNKRFFGEVRWKKDQDWIEETSLDFFSNRAGELFLVNLTKSNIGVYLCVSELNHNMYSYTINHKPEESHFNIEKIENDQPNNQYFQNFTSILENFEKLFDFFDSEC